MTYERDNIRRMRGYVWGEQPNEAGTCKLNTNENPYPPSPEVRRALAAFDTEELRTYPQPTADALRAALADHHGLVPDSVVVVNGGDEGLRMAITTFLAPGAHLGTVQPSYSLYPVLAQMHDAPLAAAELTGEWMPPDDFARRMNAAGAQLTCLTNPHAPSGCLFGTDRVRALAAELDGVLLLDEAYVDFVDPGLGYDSVRLLESFDNLLILRSFSKGYSLAGLRLGYLLGQPGLIAPLLRKTRDSYNVNEFGQRLGLAAFQDRVYAERTWAAVRRARVRLAKDLAELGLDAPPSQSNFLLAHVPDGARLTAREVYLALRNQGILVRYFDAPRLRDRLRITLGTPEQNARLVAELGVLLL